MKGPLLALLLGSLFLSPSLFSSETDRELSGEYEKYGLERASRRVTALFLVKDRERALQEARLLMQSYPEERLAYETALKSIAAYGEEAEAFALWQEFHTHFPEEALTQEVLEPLCWGVLHRGEGAPGLATQVVSLIGAALTQDRYAVAFVLDGLHHTNTRIRALSVQLAALYGDQPLREKVAQLFHTEKCVEVRIALFQAIAKLRMQALFPELVAQIENPKLSAKEKAAALRAVVALRDRVSHEEIAILASHTRAALRELACHYISEYACKEEEALLYQLAGDSHPDVQVAALKELGVMRLPPTEAIRKLARKARHPAAGITAGWVWLLAEPEKGEEALGSWLSHPQEGVRVLAAAAVAHAGPYGVELASTYLGRSEDPYVRVNLALALLRARKECERAAEEVAHFLRKECERVMIQEEGPFAPLCKSRVTPDPAIPNYPELVNQTVRLELLNLLAIVDYPGAEAEIRAFLQKSHWGVTGLAAEVLLGEGDEKAIECVTALLQAREPSVRIEAALVLASWGRDERAITPLLEAYSVADRPLQMKILEALGRIGHRSVIPFLLERLQEPSLVIRTIAASVLLQTLKA